MQGEEMLADYLLTSSTGFDNTRRCRRCLGCVQSRDCVMRTKLSYAHKIELDRCFLTWNDGSTQVADARLR